MRHRKMLAPIHTIKHYVHKTNTFVATGAIDSQDVVHAVVAPATSNAEDVVEGSIVKAVYFERWIVNSGATDTFNTFTVMIEKMPGNGTPITAAQMLNLGSYSNKKNILYTTQGVLASGVDGAQSVPVIRAWVLIPKGKQRMGLDDEIVITVHSVGSTQICGITTYKEYT